MSISLCALSVHNKKLNSICRPLAEDNYRLIDFIYTSHRVLENYSDLDIALRRIHEVLHKDKVVMSISDLDHIDVLCSFGMTPSIHKSLKNSGLTTIHQLKQLSKKEYDDHLKRESNSIYKKTQNIIKKFESVFSNNYIDIISFLLLVQHDVDKRVDVKQLIQTAEKFYSLAENKVLLTLNTLVDEGILIKNNDSYYVKKWTLHEVLNFDFPHKDTYLMRLQGVNVRDIGKETGVSRTSVLTYVSRINDHFIPYHLEENKYSIFLTKYNMPRSTFEYVFNLDEVIIDYLYCNFETHDINTDIEQIITDKILKKDQLDRLLYIEKKFINHQGKIVPQSSTNIFEDIVHKHPNQSFTLNSFYKRYMNCLKHNNIINIKPTDIRRFESIIDESEYVVKSIKHEFRYFDINISKETIDKINAILNNLDGSYGLPFIFKNNKKTLTEIGLKNGYELGSLINKVGLEKFENVNSIIRISTIQLGKRTHQEFVEDKISEFRECMVNTLLNHLQKYYGLHKDTMSTYISNQYFDYILDGKICGKENIPISKT